MPFDWPTVWFCALRSHDLCSTTSWFLAAEGLAHASRHDDLDRPVATTMSALQHPSLTTHTLNTSYAALSDVNGSPVGMNSCATNPEKFVSAIAVAIARQLSS